MKNNLRVAIVHDWLIGGGAERVVLELHRLFPDAPIYTSYCSDEWRKRLDNKVVTDWLQYWPFSRLRKYLPVLRAWWFSRLKLSGYDLIISSSGAEAKAVKTPAGAKHIAYIHAPTHYYWSRYDEYMKRPGFPAGFNWLARLGLRTLIEPLRRWDYKVAQKPDWLIANSTYTQSQIKQYYGRESRIIFPPVDVKRFQGPGVPERKGFVIAGRQTPYKRIDLAVAACARLNAHLTVIGNGPDHQKLRRMAGPTVTFLTDVSDADIVHDFQAAAGFIFPGVDDFGITPVEAMAAGTPVIAYNAGGARDYVTEGQTGLLFEEQTVESLMDALRAFSKMRFEPVRLRVAAQQFAPEVFQSQMRDFISRHTDPHLFFAAPRKR